MTKNQRKEQIENRIWLGFLILADMIGIALIVLGVLRVCQ